MKPLVAAVALCALAISACVHERLDWRRPDGSHDSAQLAEDVDACEEFTTSSEDDDRRVMSGRGARAYGGWGSFPFEFCMNQRGWVLTRVRTDGGE